MKNDKPPRRRESPAIRRALIVDEAIRFIGERGYNGFTVQALAEQCGLSNAGLLYYFGSKDQLLISLLDEVERRETENVAPLANERADGEGSPARTFQILRTIVKGFVDRPEIGRFALVLQSEALDRLHPAHEWFSIREKAVLKLFAQLASPLVEDPKSCARQLVALMFGLEQQWIRADQDFDLLAEWEKAIGMILPSIVSVEAGIDEVGAE
jgi:AcrR family transcriptional regulator